MKTFSIKTKGITALMHHRMRDEDLHALLGTKGTKKKDKETRTPREIAESYAYKNEDGTFFVPSKMISAAFAQTSSDYKQKNSIRKSYKAIAGGIFRPLEARITLKDDDGNPVKDFEVDLQKATNHQKGAVAVCRPRFDRWNLDFTVAIDEDLISPETTLDILSDSGKRAGLGSYRVARGGYFGQFQVVEFTEI